MPAMERSKYRMQPEECYVLIIEDDGNNVLVTTELLRMIGVKHINARASGRQGIKLAEGMDQVNLILLDMQLPHEDVYKVLEQIRSNPKLKHTRVVAMTCDILPQEEARAAGFDEVISKPLDFDRFPKQILALLSRF